MVRRRHAAGGDAAFEEVGYELRERGFRWRRGRAERAVRGTRLRAAMRGDAEGVTWGVNASVRWRRQAACARKARTRRARSERASRTRRHKTRMARKTATATVTSDAGGVAAGDGRDHGREREGARERAEARDPAHDASDHPVDRTHLADDDVSAARRVAEPRWTECAANGATHATESATESATIGPVDRASQCGMRPRERRDATVWPASDASTRRGSTIAQPPRTTRDEAC